MSDKPETVDAYIRARMLEGVRSPVEITEELTKAKLLGMTAAEQLDFLKPAVRAYAENRVRGWVRAVEDANGRKKMSPPTAGSEARSTTAGAPNAAGQPKGFTGAREVTAAPQRDFGPSFRTPQEAREALLNETTYVPGYGDVWNRDLTREHLQLVIKRLEDTRLGVDRSIRFRNSMIAAMDKYKAKVFGDVPLDEPLDEN